MAECPAPPVFECDVCHRQFDRKWSLQVHRLIADKYDRDGKTGNICL